jgi:DNA-binding Xre family transcriptional regulator
MNILKEKGITKKVFAESIGIKTNTMSAMSKNRNVNTSTINKACAFLNCQPGDILEYVPDTDSKKVNDERAEIERQIAELQAKLKSL